jgi:hypothetical protein
MRILKQPRSPLDKWIRRSIVSHLHAKRGVATDSSGQSVSAAAAAGGKPRRKGGRTKKGKAQARGSVPASTNILEAVTPGRQRDVALTDLQPDSAREELLDLARELTHHDHLYYNEEQPAISDADYDALARRLQDVEHR